MHKVIYLKCFMLFKKEKRKTKFKENGFHSAVQYFKTKLIYTYIYR